MKLNLSKYLMVASAISAMAVHSPIANAQPIYSSGHGDVGAGYVDTEQEFEPHWHLGSGAVVDGVSLSDEAEFEPGDLVAQTSATRTSPSGLAGAIGVPDGTTIYTAGSATYQPNLGFSVEELSPGDWTGNVTLTLSGWTIPSGAGFSVFSTNLSGTSVTDVVFSTVDPSVTFADNSLPMVPGDHVHFDWGFTDVGNYDLEFTWTGTHATDGLISTTDTFRVQVVPEPSTVAMLGLALLIVLATLRRRRRLS